MKTRKPSVLVYLTVLGAFVFTALWGSRAVTVFTESAPLKRQNCFIIDAGHGGVDGGATSCTGVLESQMNLEIALRLNDLLHLMGYQTKMMRIEDISIYTKGETIAQKKVSDLKERVRICNDTPGAFLISIHQNYFNDSRYSGAQVFYPNTEGSMEIARQLQSALIQQLNPGSKRSAKKGEGIYLLEKITCGGVLVECGFISNPTEEAKLRSADYQQKLCCVIAATVIEHISNT